MKNNIQYKSYNVLVNGRMVAKAEFPASADNCWWWNIKVWNEQTGFIKSAQHLTDNGLQFDLVEA